MNSQSAALTDYDAQIAILTWEGEGGAFPPEGNPETSELPSAREEQSQRRPGIMDAA